MMKKAQSFALASVFLILVASLVGFYSWTLWTTHTTCDTCIIAICLPVCVFVAIACWDISRSHPADECGVNQLIALWFGKRIIARIAFPPKHLAKYKHQFSIVQQQLLTSYLKTNASTAYSKDFGLSPGVTVEEFRKKHPVTTYAHYSSYIDRCWRGEGNVMCSFPIDFFFKTSGTSGTNKTYPVDSKRFLKSQFGPAVSVQLECLQRDFPSFAALTPAFVTYVVPAPRRNELGIEYGSVSSLLGKTLPSLMNVAPVSLTSLATCERDSHYLMAIYGLQKRQIAYVDHGFASTARAFYDVVTDDWRSLCKDIECGTISSNISIPDELRQSLLRLLTPNPVRAAELRVEFSLGMKRIVPRIWPELRLVLAVTTGGFKVYHEYLKYLLGDDIPVVTNIHPCTEGFLGVNCQPKSPREASFTLLPRSGFYEFIPEEEIPKERPDTVLPSELEIGKLYEVVITRDVGLYRYRFGDVIKIVDFDGDLPVYNFMYRVGQMLNVSTEKMPESAFCNAVQSSLSEWDDVLLHEYTATESANIKKMDVKGLNRSGLFYVVFVEVVSKETRSSMKLPDEFSNQLDDYLRSEHEAYEFLRNRGQIQKPAVCFVSNGTFLKLKGLIVQDKSDTAVNQFKFPKAQRNEKYLKFLCDHIL